MRYSTKLSDRDQPAKIKAAFPNMTVSDHEEAVGRYVSKANEAARSYMKEMKNAEKVYGEGDKYQWISGVGKEHFPEGVKDNLRSTLAEFTDAQANAALHYKAAGKRVPFHRSPWVAKMTKALGYGLGDMKANPRKPSKAISFAGYHFDIEDGRYTPRATAPDEDRVSTRRGQGIKRRVTLLDEGSQYVKDSQMNAYSSACERVERAQTAIRAARVTRDPSYLEQAKYALKAAKWAGVILAKSPYAFAEDRALVRRKISEATRALREEEQYMKNIVKNPHKRRIPPSKY